MTISNCTRELRLAVRGRRRKPTFSVVVVGTLALAVAASTVIYSIVRGRTFAPDELRVGAAPVAVVSYGFWQRAMGAQDLSGAALLSVADRRFTLSTSCRRSVPRPCSSQCSASTACWRTSWRSVLRSLVFGWRSAPDEKASGVDPLIALRAE
jgi:hypothetical protein